MEAGHRLDDLIAEKVMGWEKIRDGWNVGWLTPENVLLPGEFAPSTDIAAAWDVVEKVLNDLEGEALPYPYSRGFTLTISDGDYGFSTLGDWEAGFVLDSGDYYHESWKHSADAATPAHAICLAALTAKGIEVD